MASESEVLVRILEKQDAMVNFYKTSFLYAYINMNACEIHRGFSPRTICTTSASKKMQQKYVTKHQQWKIT